MSIVICLILFILVGQDNLIRFTKISLLTNFDEILVVILFALFLIGIKKNKISVQNVKLLIAMFVFCVIGILSCYLNSDFKLKNVLMSCFLSIKFWIILISCSALKFNRKITDYIYKGLFFIEKIAIFFAFINIFFLDIYKVIFPTSYILHRFNLVSVSSIFIHPGKYGWFMLFCTIAHFSIYACSKEKKDLRRTIISAFACLLSLRTKVILSMIICFGGYLLYLNRESLKKQVKKIVIFVIFIVIMSIPFKDIVYNTYLLYYTENEGYSVRQALSDNSYKIAQDYFPLGVGFGKYGTLYAARNYSEYYYKYNMSHMYGITPSNTSYSMDTFWPAILGETGILGIITYVYMIIILTKKLISNYNHATNDDKSIKIFALLALVQLVTESFGAASFTSPPNYFLTAFVVGVSMSCNKGSVVNEE